jgi:hypothetical protein
MMQLASRLRGGFMMKWSVSIRAALAGKLSAIQTENFIGPALMVFSCKLRMY